ncbi:MAG: hypothetical protein UY26_C0003G0242 [Candidatus Jorgensenbacteria bacterium GW2011_GWA1_48_13]|uniref:Small ribosomal subunit protein bS6 n=2 Tax=Candidatus Joergenseniibacteriota TaxID=1752739 RepID=A0A0G1YIP8_9BACT|nr:MAG: hypothetical protein UY26_C0003G0242 [Candidatus Jorgensenbacteria bacterium GW2011_GWA1_48_13]KKU98718.1 MAG: hypothetical protein UY32_C0016G0013 [Candidatus Jorgensenbacteria bacterium GW2011_GWC1_48_8]KKW14872.1 MAG: hypothetical protein UY55_C0003G0089 [Candidatus Jorgensenbacteria bacterium GW2011_GWB1_50_10]
MYELTAVTKEENFAPLKEVLARSGVKILSEEAPKKIHMFYPVKKERYGFLGVFKFESAPEALGRLSADLNLKGEVLRFVIVKPKKVKIRENESPTRSTAPRDFLKAPIVKKPAEAALTNEELEKKIEEILK